jgi:hypothetical protein
MAWRHYEVRASGATLIEDDDNPIAATYEMGIISTGLSRVFAGHFVSITLPSGTDFSGEDEHSLRAALRKLAAHLAAVDLELRCFGMEDDFSESGLSADTGFGYLPGYDSAIHMMDVPSKEERAANEDDDIDRLVRNAVEGMRIGICFKE